MERFADLDELVVGCRTAAAKGYIADAVASYRAGAFRPSITATWVAVVFDLIDKLRELAIAGDAKAKTEVSNLKAIQARLDRGERQAIGDALRFERGILDLARDQFQLLDCQQYTDMVRLKEDRDRCAHPTFQHTGLPYQPPAEAVRAHLRNAMVHVLHLPPVQGRAALEELRHRVGSDYFPKVRNAAKENLAGSSLGRATDALVGGAVDEMLFGFFESGNPYFKKQTVAAAIGGVIDLHRAVALPRAVLQLDKLVHRIPDELMKSFVGLLGAVPDLWCELAGSSRNRVESFVRGVAATDTAKALKYALAIEGLRDIVRDRIKCMTSEDLEAMIAAGVETEVVERAVELYTNVGSWNSANAVAMKIVLPLLPKLTPEHVERIIRSPKDHGADLPGSVGFNEFLTRVRKEGPVSPDELDRLLIKYDLSSYASQAARAPDDDHEE